MSVRTWKWCGAASVVLMACVNGAAFAQAPLPMVPPPTFLAEQSTPARQARPPVAAAQPATAQTPPLPNGDKPLAVINGEAITWAHLEQASKQAGPTPVQLPEDRKKQIQMELLSLLMDELLMKQFLAKQAPPVSPGEIDKKVADLQEGLKKDGKTLADLCRETNQSEGRLRAELAFRLQWQHYATARVTEAEVQRYYQEFRDFFDGTTVRVSHIVLRLAPTASESEVETARAKLTGLRADLLAKKVEFAAAAKAHSQCKSAENGGDIGFVPRKWVVEEAFARAAFALPVGQVSEVVHTDFGLHLIKVLERKAGQPSSYEKMKDEVREFYIEDLRQKLLMQQRKAAKIEVNLP